MLINHANEMNKFVFSVSAVAVVEMIQIEITAWTFRTSFSFFIFAQNIVLAPFVRSFVSVTIVVYSRTSITQHVTPHRWFSDYFMQNRSPIILYSFFPRNLLLWPAVDSVRTSKVFTAHSILINEFDSTSQPWCERKSYARQMPAHWCTDLCEQ